MKLLVILIFGIVHYSSLAQTDEMLLGKYQHVEKRGIHVEPGASYGNMHVTSYISFVDTTITYTLLLDSAHQAVLQIDTVLALTFFPEYKWIGLWEIDHNTLSITFTTQSVLYPFTLLGEKPMPYIDILPDTIVKKYQLEIYHNQVQALRLEEEHGLRYIKMD